MFTKRRVQIDAAEPGVYKVTVDHPTNGLVIGETDGFHVTDNCIDLVPGDPLIIEYRRPEPGLRTAVPEQRFDIWAQRRTSKIFAR